jgi:hypothetical protein
VGGQSAGVPREGVVRWNEQTGAVDYPPGFPLNDPGKSIWFTQRHKDAKFFNAILLSYGSPAGLRDYRLQDSVLLCVLGVFA